MRPRFPEARSNKWNWIYEVKAFRTNPEMTLPSACPAMAAVAKPMTLPMSAMELAPVSETMAFTLASISASVKAAGRKA